MDRQYCASVFVIDHNLDKILLMYNHKLNKWLQPGGHIEGFELPHETAIRECKEETGVYVKIISNSGFLLPTPIAIEHYQNNVGDMIDIQYYGIPLNIVLSNDENNLTGWFSLEELIEKEVDKEIVNKFKILTMKIKDI